MFNYIPITIQHLRDLSVLWKAHSPWSYFGGVDPMSKVEINGTKVSKKIFDDFLKAGNK